jgi:predicted nucleic acid-binding protein
MNLYFIDSSALVKRYNHESGSRWIDNLVAENIVHISPITKAEVIAALARAGNAGKAARTTSAKQINLFREDIADGAIAVVQPAMEMFERAADLAANGALRGCDAVQLAAAMHLRDALGRAAIDAGVVFVCSDAALNDVANSLGFVTQNPIKEES